MEYIFTLKLPNVQWSWINTTSLRKPFLHILYHNMKAVEPFKMAFTCFSCSNTNKTTSYKLPAAVCSIFIICIIFVLGKMMHGPWRFPASPRDLSVNAHASISNYVCKRAGREAEKWCIYTVKCSSLGLKNWPSCHHDKYPGKRKPCIFFFRYNWLNMCQSTFCLRGNVPPQQKIKSVTLMNRL